MDTDRICYNCQLSESAHKFHAIGYRCYGGFDSYVKIDLEGVPSVTVATSQTRTDTEKPQVTAAHAA